MKLLFLAVALVVSGSAHAQFDLEESHTTASLRGIDSLGAGVAWASGSGGTVLRTEDGGYLWQPCTVPKGAEKLDFRGVQGFDANTAVVMASGKGALSRVYKTTDGCQTWKLVFGNPDAEGFFDDLRKVTSKQMYMLGDPVQGKFRIFFSPDSGSNWFVSDDPGLEAATSDGAFAASNSGLISLANSIYFGTGGGSSAHVFNTYAKCSPGAAKDTACPIAWQHTDVPLAAGSAGAGVFSLAGRFTANQSGQLTSLLVAVGGDYTKPESPDRTAATSRDGGKSWSLAVTSPRGYRSAIVFDREAQSWLAVGPTGTDLSRDDGRTWKPVLGDTATGWNAVSLPFVVGAKGRIGKLREQTSKP